MIKITKLGPLPLIVKTKSAILVGRGVFHTTGVSDTFTQSRFSSLWDSHSGPRMRRSAEAQDPHIRSKYYKSWGAPSWVRRF